MPGQFLAIIINVSSITLEQQRRFKLRSKGHPKDIFAIPVFVIFQKLSKFKDTNNGHLAPMLAELTSLIFLLLHIFDVCKFGHPSIIFATLSSFMLIFVLDLFLIDKQFKQLPILPILTAKLNFSHLRFLIFIFLLLSHDIVWLLDISALLPNHIHDSDAKLQSSSLLITKSNIQS